MALFEPDIPQNTGSMIRLCACLGIPLHVIEPCGFPFDDRKLRRVALDYYDLTEIVRHRSWRKFLEFRQGRRLILLSTKGAAPYTQFAFSPEDILLLGRESSGVPDYARKESDAAITVPMHPGARSLNVALAAAMVAGEALRQLGSNKGGQ